MKYLFAYIFHLYFFFHLTFCRKSILMHDFRASLNNIFEIIKEVILIKFCMKVCIGIKVLVLVQKLFIKDSNYNVLFLGNIVGKSIVKSTKFCMIIRHFDNDSRNVFLWIFVGNLSRISIGSFIGNLSVSKGNFRISLIVWSFAKTSAVKSTKYWSLTTKKNFSEFSVSNCIVDFIGTWINVCNSGKQENRPKVALQYI